MRIPLCVAVILVLAAALPLTSHSQGEAALPFLLISPSHEANGMGGTGIALERYEPAASIFSPAQVGLSALSTNVRGGFYPSPVKMLTAFQQSDLEYSVWGVGVGLRLNDLVDLPFRLGVGLTYHHVLLDLGTFVQTGSGGPGEIGEFEAYESASGFVIGVGVEYLLRLGIGFTFRSVKSNLSPIGTEEEPGSGDFEGNANDYSFLLEAPLISVGEAIAGGKAVFGGGLRPSLDVSAGVGWNNMGDEVVYIDPDRGDPFPRTARAGIALKGGIRLEEPSWELISAAWSREAEDLLVVRDAGGWEYQSGLGDLRFGENVIQGSKTLNVTLREGWQVGIGEVFTYRTGSVEGGTPFDTWGYMLQLSGLLKGLTLVAGSNVPDWLIYARDHVDLQFNSSHYDNTHAESETTSYSALTVIVRGWLW